MADKARGWGWPLTLLTLILLSHIVPTVVIGFGYVIPGSCIAGWNEHTYGFLASIIGYVPTYVFGCLLAWRLGARARA